MSSSSTAKPTFTAPTHADGEAQTLVFEDVVTGRGTATGGAHRATATVTVEIAEFTAEPWTVTISGTAMSSSPIADDGLQAGRGDRDRGDVQRNAVTITGDTADRADDRGKHPQCELRTRKDRAQRFGCCSGTRSPQADTDNDGFSIPANALALPTQRTISGRANGRKSESLDHSSAGRQSADHKRRAARKPRAERRDMRTGPTEVRNGIGQRHVERRRQQAVTNCSQVTSAHLAGADGNTRI